MAFGDVTGTFQANAASIVAAPALALSTGSGAVSVGDIVVVMLCEQTGLTVTDFFDSQGGSSGSPTYTAQNAGTLSGTNVSGRCFWRRVTVAGTLTSITGVASASSHNYAAVAAIIDGPFVASPVDANPANTTTDTSSPFTTPATGTLAQAILEVVVSWIAQTGSNTLTATAPTIKAIQQNSVNVVGAILGTQVPPDTTSVTPAYTGTAPTDNVLGTISFLGDTTITVLIETPPHYPPKATTVSSRYSATKGKAEFAIFPPPFPEGPPQ